jgi:hypothetical protein
MTQLTLCPKQQYQQYLWQNSDMVSNKTRENEGPRGYLPNVLKSIFPILFPE